MNAAAGSTPPDTAALASLTHPETPDRASYLDSTAALYDSAVGYANAQAPKVTRVSDGG